MRIGFIGTGFIGSAYARDMRKRGLPVVQYSLDKKFKKNKEKIRKCDLVFIAVPTPTRNGDCDISAILSSLRILKERSIAVIKSTIPPHTTERLQDMFPDLFIFHSPEFLRARSAKEDAGKPERNIIGIAYHQDYNVARLAQIVHSYLPNAEKNFTLKAREAEIVKYAGNFFLFLKVVYANIVYDLCKMYDVDYEIVKNVVGYDSRIGHSHLDVNFEGGRGAGGYCFIKDVEVLKNLMVRTDYKKLMQELVNQNLRLLKESDKDINIIKKVYGKSKSNRPRKLVKRNKVKK